MKHLRFAASICGQTFIKSRLHIALALIIEGDTILIRRRARGADHLPDVPEFPGGKIEQNETPEQAAIREAREETGLEIKIVRALDSTVGLR